MLLLPALLFSILSLCGAHVCDIFGRGGTPCVAAYSITRALYATYTGPLYRVLNPVTGGESDISVVAAGGAANASAQENFCGDALCVAVRIYDQSPWGNHLGMEHGAPWHPPPRNSQDTGVNMTAAAKIRLGGAPVFSAVFDSRCETTRGSCDGLVAGYSNRSAAGTPVGDEPQTVYALFDGKHYNTGCCFEFGNVRPRSQQQRCAYYTTADTPGPRP